MIERVTGVDNRCGGTDVDNKRWSVAGGAREDIVAPSLSPLFEGVGVERVANKLVRTLSLAGVVLRLLWGKWEKRKMSSFRLLPLSRDPSFVGRNL